MKEKILSLSAADEWVLAQRASSLKIGFTCGAFDILHAGHVNLLERARAMCDRLLVAVNSDQSIKSYKNPLRPVNSQDARMSVVAGLASADAVVLMDDLRPARLIERWHPEFYIKGGDYETSGLRSRPLVESYGGQVVLLPFEVDASTTSLIERIEAAARHAAQPVDSPGPAKLVFVDRDGTMIKHIPYLHEPQRVQLLPGVGEGLATLEQAGFRIVMATNQQGIALGYYSLEDFYAVNLQVFRQLAPFGVSISRVAFCPHAIADGCSCRKPLPGMLLAALDYYHATPGDCYMVGDSVIDAGAAEQAGCFPILIAATRPGVASVPGFREAVQLILDREAGRM